MDLQIKSPCWDCIFIRKMIDGEIPLPESRAILADMESDLKCLRKLMQDVQSAVGDDLEEHF